MADLDTDREPYGFLMIDCPDTGLVKPLGYWLPDGVCPFEIGIADARNPIGLRAVVREIAYDGSLVIDSRQPVQLECIKFQAHRDVETYRKHLDELFGGVEAEGDIDDE